MKDLFIKTLVWIYNGVNFRITYHCGRWYSAAWRKRILYWWVRQHETPLLRWFLHEARSDRRVHNKVVVLMRRKLEEDREEAEGAV